MARHGIRAWLSWRLLRFVRVTKHIMLPLARAGGHHNSSRHVVIRRLTDDAIRHNTGGCSVTPSPRTHCLRQHGEYTYCYHMATSYYWRIGGCYELRNEQHVTWAIVVNGGCNVGLMRGECHTGRMATGCHAALIVTNKVINRSPTRLQHVMFHHITLNQWLCSSLRPSLVILPLSRRRRHHRFGQRIWRPVVTNVN